MDRLDALGNQPRQARDVSASIHCSECGRNPSFDARHGPVGGLDSTGIARNVVGRIKRFQEENV